MSDTAGTRKDGGGVWYKNNPANILGESPIYRASDSTLHWIDVHSSPCTIHILKIDPTTGAAVGSAHTLKVPFDSITAIYFRKGKPGSYICGYHSGIAYLDEKTGEVEVLKELIPKEARHGLTMNDGGVDPQGRFWIGAADLIAAKAKFGGAKLPDNYGEPRGTLWRYDPDGTCTAMKTGVFLGNGIGWSPDGKCMFYNDSGTQTLSRYDFDGATGDISNEKRVIEGLPPGVMNDGMVVDQDGSLWVAMKIFPEGHILDQIGFPAKCITCPAWGGEKNDILFITSAQPIVEKAAPGDEGGHIFQYKPGVKGLPKYEFAG
ncbi:hypothetical protein BGZ60DRAFT_502321 [Tricladium varicosporioides]|nr:hypothetical protein BGZ60DRAFT_502321 [Hymenoscyphus varicosporioides]